MSDDKRHPLEPKPVGKGLDAPKHNPADPQAWLAGSNHPYAPFPGNALKWESRVWDDGTTYEGLAREGVPHGKGVMVFGNGTGGGFQRVDRGDKYEGEFAYGFAHGLGMHTRMNGEIYRGEYLLGKRHGCGALVDMRPYYQAWEGEGEDGPWDQGKDEAFQRMMPAIRSNMQLGQFKKDLVAGSAGSSGFCSLPEVQGTLQEVEEVVTRARMFQYKPDGDVTLMTFQAEGGVPVTTFQDPLLYPHHTKFLAPGPLGQCHPIPDDAALRAEMLRHARNYQRIYNMYNLPWKSEPGSDMRKAIEAFDARLGKARRKLRRTQELEKRRLRRLEQSRGVKPAEQAQEEGKKEQRPRGGRGQQPPPPPPEDDDDDDGEFDDDDLIASTAGLDLSRQQSHADDANASHSGQHSRWGGLPPPTAFGSVSLGMTRAVGGLCAVMEHFAQRAQRRRCLTRPRR